MKAFSWLETAVVKLQTKSTTEKTIMPHISNVYLAFIEQQFQLEEIILSSTLANSFAFPSASQWLSIVEMAMLRREHASDDDDVASDLDKITVKTDHPL